SGAGRQPVRAHLVEISLRIWKRPDRRHRPDFRRISLAGNRIWLAALRWRQDRPVAAAGPIQQRSASPLQQHRQTPRRTRWDSLDRHQAWARELEERPAYTVWRASWTEHPSDY